MLPFPRSAFEQARARMGEFVYHTPLLTSRLLSERTGFDVRLKAEMFQRGGSYKIRGPMNKFAQLTDEQKRRGVICSSAGNHAQGVALAAARHGIKAVVCMAENATPSKIAATRAYGAEVVLHGTIWDEANEKAKQLVAEQGYTYIHPFDDEQLIVGQGTVGLEIYQDWPEVELAIVPIGGGGLISGVATALKACNPAIKVIGVESSGAPGMTRSVREGGLLTLDTIDCIIDGLRVKRVGEKTYDIVRQSRRRSGHAAGRADLRGGGVDHVAPEGRPGGSRRRARRRAAAGADQGRPGNEGRLRPERRQRQPRSAQGAALELGSDRGQTGVRPGSDRGQTGVRPGVRRQQDLRA